MTPPRLLIAGIGNIFLGDDAFGCEVVQRLLQRAWPENVHVVDYGIRGLDLAYALTDRYDTAILVDATPQGDAPGTIYTMELSLESIGEPSAIIDAHGMQPLNVLRLVQTLGGTQCRILLVGCEPADFGDESEGRMGLSPAVQQAIEPAVKAIESLVAECGDAAALMASPGFRQE